MSSGATAQHCSAPVQGTACSALAGIYGALSVQSLPPSALCQQRIVMLGAGSAGIGVCSLTAKAMMKHGMTQEQAQAHFWVCDKEGLVTHHRNQLPPHVQGFARWDRHSTDGEGLLDVVKRVKPTGAEPPDASLPMTGQAACSDVLCMLC